MRAVGLGVALVGAAVLAGACGRGSRTARPERTTATSTPLPGPVAASSRAAVAPATRGPKSIRFANVTFHAPATWDIAD
ncbi:MAG: hypothetical protein LC792_16530 [Actinobacteria bacterium]|nr:hypothetical protein [Actinomycetota bacterium]